MVVIAPEHRDGSAPVTYMKTAGSNKLKPIYFSRSSHTPSPETFEHRDSQLKIRLWELGLTHDAVQRIQLGSLPLHAGFSDTVREHGELLDVLKQLKGQLDVEPGKIVFAGHSFGAATTVQLVKTVFYNLRSNDPAYRALYTPRPDSSIVRQITPKTTTILLDMWCLPLKSPSTEWLWSKPLPCYAPGGSGGSSVLAILSETFYKWRGNMDDMKLACIEDPTDESSASSRPPFFFYPKSSAHLSQSDFAVLFPRVTRMAFKAEDPERCIQLNIRAMLQLLRENGFEVSSTSKSNLPEYTAEDATTKAPVSGAHDDWRILASEGGVSGWSFIDLMRVDESDSSGSGSDSSSPSKTKDWTGPSDAVVEGEVLGEVEVRGQHV